MARQRNLCMKKEIRLLKYWVNEHLFSRAASLNIWCARIDTATWKKWSMKINKREERKLTLAYNLVGGRENLRKAQSIIQRYHMAPGTSESLTKIIAQMLRSPFARNWLIDQHAERRTKIKGKTFCMTTNRNEHFYTDYWRLRRGYLPLSGNAHKLCMLERPGIVRLACDICNL